MCTSRISDLEKLPPSSISIIQHQHSTGTAEQGRREPGPGITNPNFATLKCVGLTINWNFSFTGTAQDARGIVRTLNQQAQDLPFALVSDIVELKGAECKPGIYSHDDPRLDTLRDGRRMLSMTSLRYPMENAAARSTFTQNTSWDFTPSLARIAKLPALACADIQRK